MTKQIVAITIEKVQTFLFEVLQAHIQEHQSNSGTLQEIIQSSNFISKQLYQDIGLEANIETDETRAFVTEEVKDVLLQCSGMCIFSTTLQQSEVEQRLDKLFTKYYLNFKGQLLLKYVCFEQTVQNDRDKLKAIFEGKRRLKQTQCLNDIIMRNQSLLFQFSEQTKNKRVTVSSKNTIDQYQSTFTSNINELFSDHEADNENHFRIAIIKADLDGMGALFERIEEYDVYRDVSRILSKMICLEFLSKKAADLKERIPNFKLYPLYIAGDDIFFAVSVAHLIDGVKLCNEILKHINKEIEQLNGINKQQMPMLSMSIGIEFSYNREPIRYYNERVQRQLDTAKAAPALAKKSEGKLDSLVKICINGFVLYDSQILKDANKEAVVTKPDWKHFVSDINRLKEMMQSGFAAHHFLYSLLEKITNLQTIDNPIKYSNAVLYHLMPNCVANSTPKEREDELILLGVLMSQLFVKKFHGKSNTNFIKEISIAPQQQERLEKYVRLLLVFSDPRFSLSDTKQEKTNFLRDHRARLRGTLFNNPMRFLHEQSLLKLLVSSGAGVNSDQAERLRALFIKEQSYLNPSKVQSDKKGAGNKDKVEVYRTLKLSSSMLHRLKRLHKNKTMNIDKIAEMIGAINFSSKEEIIELELLNEKEGKAPPRLYFDKEKFKDIVNQTKLWDSDYLDDYLDTLLIFYRLKELSIQYKILYPKISRSQKNNNRSRQKNNYQSNKNNRYKGAKQWPHKK